MSEHDITHLVTDADCYLLSGSVNELGPLAARLTWQNSCDEGEARPLLKTPEDLDSARDHFEGYGAWDADEVAAWTDADLQGLAAQEAASGLRELASALDINVEDLPGATSGELEEAWATSGGRVYPGAEGRWYLYLGE